MGPTHHAANSTNNCVQAMVHAARIFLCPHTQTKVTRAAHAARLSQRRNLEERPYISIKTHTHMSHQSTLEQFVDRFRGISENMVNTNQFRRGALCTHTPVVFVISCASAAASRDPPTSHARSASTSDQEPETEERCVCVELVEVAQLLLS